MDTALKHVCGNRCAFLPLCLFPGARLHAEADAPSQWEHGGCWQCGGGGGVGSGRVSSTALPPAYRDALPTSHTVSAGKKKNCFSECSEMFMDLFSPVIPLGGIFSNGGVLLCLLKLLNLLLITFPR